MEEAKGDYGGPTADDRKAARRLEEMWHELDQMRQGLPPDSLHSNVFGDLGVAQAALQRARDKLILRE
jgi:hypothetical protein